MQFTNFRIILLGSIICSAIFAADLAFGIGAISLSYIIFMILAFWIGTRNYHIIASVLSAIVLNIIGWIYQSKSTIVEFDLGGFHSTLDYEGLFRVFTSFILIVVGIVLIKQKGKEDELNSLNESLELRILARTSASENRARKLEKQIKALKLIRSEQTNESIKRLDDVINELKELNKLEYTDV